MADTTTTNLLLTKPEVGASTDTWGTKINTDLGLVDSVFDAAGTGTSVGLNVGSGKTLTVAGTLNLTGTGNINAVNTFGFKNRIINGGMVIDQRNAGASVTPINDQYLVDRFQAVLTQSSKLTTQQSTTASTGFVNSLLITSSSAYSVLSGDFFGIRQSIEGLNVADLAWGTSSAATITLSFWVRSSLTGTFGGSVFNSAGNRSYPFSYTISVANTWEQKSVTIAGDTTGTWLTTNGKGIQLLFGLGVGSTYSGTANTWSGSTYFAPTGATSVVGTNGATFYITGVQLEKGSTATSFDFRDYGTELALCQRYFYKFGGAAAYSSGIMGSSTFMRAFYAHPVEMRINTGFTITTTVTGYGSGATQINVYSNNGFLTNSSFTFAFDFVNSKTISYYLTTMGGGTGGYTVALDFGSSAFILVSAEL